MYMNIKSQLQALLEQDDTLARTDIQQWVTKHFGGEYSAVIPVLKKLPGYTFKAGRKGHKSRLERISTSAQPPVSAISPVESRVTTNPTTTVTIFFGSANHAAKIEIPWNLTRESANYLKQIIDLNTQKEESQK